MSSTPTADTGVAAPPLLDARFGPETAQKVMHLVVSVLCDALRQGEPVSDEVYSRLKHDLDEATALNQRIAEDASNATPETLARLKELNAGVSGELHRLPIGELRTHRNEIKPALDAYQASAEGAVAASRRTYGTGSEATAGLATENLVASGNVGAIYQTWAAANRRDGLVPQD